MRQSSAAGFAAALFVAMFAQARAADEFSVETLLSRLRTPCGIAVRPGDSNDRYEIFVADSGAGRIIRLASDKADSAVVDVVTGFPLTELGDDGRSIGPLGLFFLDRQRLVVGAGGDDGAEVLLFELADDLSALSAEKPTQQISLMTDRQVPIHAYALTRTRANPSVRDALLVTCFSNEQSGDVRMIPLRADTLAEPQTFISADADAKPTSPRATTTSDGGYVVVAWTGTSREPADSQLGFYNPANGAQLLLLSTELHDIVALAYSPRTGNLFAADAAWRDAKRGGVYRIDAADKPNASKCKAVKIADAVRPSALSFGPDGALYVTAFGDAESDESAGVVFKITGTL